MTLCPDFTPSLVSPGVNNVRPQDTPLKLGVMASGNGSNFDVVAQAIENGQLNAKIQVLIYNNPTAKAAVKAANRGIEAVLLNHREYKSRKKFDEKIVQTLRQHDVEWVILAGWMRLLTSVFIDAFPNKIINIHPSLLPSFKGINAVEQALASGVKITGCTVHIACLEMDSGPILMQAAVPVLPDDTPETLHARIQIQEHRILPMAIALAAANTNS
ncbi:phosphoribosylglycinamide formyltransferase [Nostoc linckia z18]|uniref:Phosphoribosylglycinamide formyltransferase n=2 Tax=Nostoc linckia TaxID=92942 RepID=A0A9Q5Z5C6_NOSLI|nr:phosphoribosylglycinamide formyltransferase [Nostoc linckia]PHK40554.1 phosphoribosylglycinamide formyltransferase [Nostoc linckia z16]PHJ55380.1 phosphoribosylglycinamide formyltransferase [Nostoc linckia z1]PHJ56789.1 phosphoribosylglycinamide formyltransferase [Nostoc linckia z3]PHJ57844.1 phosphoribosylglycinamide formyltransferase [Nostoc linckia z2]PHJ74815.1 phosphoribosylglycinamide formyltransferase [Nostoc linckia z4]